MNIFVSAPERDFLWPYFRQALPEVTFTDSIDMADRCILISSVDIYATESGNLIEETTEIDNKSSWASYENDFKARCTSSNKRHIILRSADIIGTGMTGWPRELAERIWKGTLMHFAGNEARTSVVHATDLADAVAELCTSDIDTEGVFNITDGENPTFHDLVDSLAFRMKNKHVSTLSTKGQLWFGRFFYGQRLYRKFTTTRTFSCASLCRIIDYNPTPITHYLHTHTYDESSL